MLKRLFKRSSEPSYLPEERSRFRPVLAVLGVLILIISAIGFYWDTEPDLFDVREAALKRAGGNTSKLVTGYVTTSTLIEVVSTLLDKRGGYLSNDVMPPSVLMDNIPNWEFGVLVQVRDLARVLRNDISRSQTQSVEDRNLSIADPRLHFDSDAWIFPSTEGEYRTGLDHLTRYLDRLHDPAHQDAQFYARADNLREWLALVSKRLGSLSQRLSASVGQARLNVDLGGETAGAISTVRPGEMEVKTPWMQIDDVFYETRGATWALVHFLRAAEVDFESVLKKKNALVSLRQIIRELEATQQTLWSPMVLNGSEFALVANHSLVMASYVSRANAAVMDLVNLLQQG
jgi:hypothetical protein